MRPPYCYVCGAPAYHTEGGELVRFSDRPAPNGPTGQPRGVEWVCKAHLAEARKLQSRTLGETASASASKLGTASGQ